MTSISPPTSAREHILEAITPASMTEGGPVALDCSCGAVIESAGDPESIKRAFAAHPDGDWRWVFEKPHSLCGSWLVRASVFGPGKWLGGAWPT